jgi:hypothetical protein
LFGKERKRLEDELVAPSFVFNGGGDGSERDPAQAGDVDRSCSSERVVDVSERSPSGHERGHRGGAEVRRGVQACGELDRARIRRASSDGASAT